MEKTLKQIVQEAGKVPIEQTRKDLAEARKRPGFMKEYHRLAWESAEYRMTSPDPLMPPESRSKE